MEIVSTIYTFHLVMCGHDVFVVASMINNVDCCAVQPNVSSCHDDTKVLDQHFFVVAVANRPASSQVLWCFIAMVRDCDWHNQFYCECFGTFTIVKGCGPVTYYGEELVVALHSVHGPNAAYCRLAGRTWSLALVAKGSLSSCMTYAANRPCGKGLIVIPS
jgi:hypothetical protein